MHDPGNPNARYHRQTLLPGIGTEGQRRLGDAHAVIVGCGALGCGVADQVARAGVGALTLIDRDIVEPTNLQRQTLFDERDVEEGLPKAIAARRRLGEINSGVRVEAHVADLNARTLPALLPEDLRIDVLLDGADNFETRLLVNDLAVSRGIPYVYAGVIGTRGMVMPVVPGRAGGPADACLRCLFQAAPAPGTMPTCDTAGVLGAAVGVVTALQAAEAIKVMVGAVDCVSRDLVEIDVWSGGHRRLAAAPLRDPDCACCVRRDFAYLEGRAGMQMAVLCGRGSVQVSPEPGVAPVDLAGLARRLEAVAEVRANLFLVRATLASERGDREGESLELTVFRDGRALVSGTTRQERARAVYDRYIG